VVDDVRRIREHPLVSRKIPIYGYVYDVHSGNLIEVKEATEAGVVAPERSDTVRFRELQ
jgi:carbonic anhydrase